MTTWTRFGQVSRLTIFACLTFFVVARSQTPIEHVRGLDGFNAFYQNSLKEFGIVGSSFVFVAGGRIVKQSVYGSAHVQNKYPVDNETIFHWASITKTFGAIAIMQLRDRGKLSLDHPIVKYIPEIARVHARVGSVSEITIRHLLNHSAGFRSATFPWGGDRDWHPAEPSDWSQIVSMLPYTEIEFKPGSRFAYSNLGYVFLGQLVERLSGEDWEVYIEKNILKPLEMYNSYFDTTPYFLLKHRSHSYSRTIDGGIKPFRFDMDTGVTVSNGGLNSPLPDMVKYLRFLIGDKVRSELFDIVLKRSSLEEMWRPNVDAARDGSEFGVNRKDWMGLGFYIEENYGLRYFGHSGGQNGFVSQFFIHPQTRSGYIVAFNTMANPTVADPGRSTGTLNRKIKEYLFQNVFPKLQLD